MILLRLGSQFYIQLVFKAPLCITLTISDQKVVSGSLFFQLFEGKKNKKFFENIVASALKSCIEKS